MLIGSRGARCIKIGHTMRSSKFYKEPSSLVRRNFSLSTMPCSLILIGPPEEHLSMPQKQILDMPKFKMLPNLQDRTTSSTRQRVSGEVSHLTSYPNPHNTKSDSGLPHRTLPFHFAVAFDFRMHMTAYALYPGLGLDAHACSRDIEVRYLSC